MHLSYIIEQGTNSLDVGNKSCSLIGKKSIHIREIVILELCR